MKGKKLKRSKKLNMMEVNDYLLEEETLDNREEYRDNRLTNEIKIKFKKLSPGQRNLIQDIKNKEIIFCSGPAGTGKTYVSCGISLDLLRLQPEKYHKIILIKSVITLPGEEIGFLKGSLKEKMEPFMMSFMGNIEKLIGKNLLKKLNKEEIIEIKPIAYLRGLSIDNALIIVDEAQNISIGNIRTILTRIGENSKLIFLGDTNQIDIKNKSDSALKFIFDNFSDFEDFGFTEMTEEDEARNPIVIKIEKRFNEIIK